MDGSVINYHYLMDAMPDAFAYHQVIRSANGSLVDYLYLDVNQAFLEMTGLTREKVIGSKGSELHQKYSETTFDWLGVFEKSLRTEENICFERFFEAAGRYCDISVFSCEPECFAVIYRCITAKSEREKELLESGTRAKQKLASILAPDGSIEDFRLEDLIDVEMLQEMMNNFYKLTGIGVTVLDSAGKFLVRTGWQDVCTKFHRVHLETSTYCIESDMILSNGIEEGDFRCYKCKNNMWDIATPIIIGGRKLGNLYLGQFFFDDEEVDYDLFRRQAKRYGFNEKEYMEALEKVPRWSRETVDTVMNFYTQLVNNLSQLSYNNIEKAYLLSERERNIENLRQAEKDLAIEAGLRIALLDNIPNCIAFILKKDSREIVASNKMAHEVGALPGLTCYATSAERGDPCPFCQASKMWETGKLQRLEVEYRGTWYEGIWSPLSDELYVHYIFDITERKQLDEKIRYLSYHDQLTGLYNRHYLENEMKRLDTERQLPISIIMADLNHLKLVNDTFGHAMGDEMLKKAAAVIGQSCRSEDIIARWGGDEFLIYLPKTEESEAVEICQRIEEGFKENSIADIPMSIALGAATKTDLRTELDSVFKKAEDRMYEHKLNYLKSDKRDVFKVLADKLAKKSYESEQHLRSMKRIAEKIAGRLDLSEQDLARLELLVNLHDIGEVNIPEEIFKKETNLSAADWALIKKHPENGHRIVRTAEDYACVADEILAHHEKWDGSGYPKCLRGEEIPLLARILAAADAFEVMKSGRPYKRAMTSDDIAAEFKQEKGKHFDPQIAEIVLEIIERDKVQ